MKAMRIVLLVLVALTAAGCINIGKIPDPPKIDIRVNGDGNSEPSILIDIGDNANTSTLGAENGVLFYAYDALAYPQQEHTLTVRLVSSRTLEGLRGVSITFTQDERGVAGIATTNSHGMAGLVIKPAARGDYNFTAAITSIPANIADDVLEVTPTRVLLAARNVDDKFVVVIVDSVLVRPSLGSLLDGEDILPMPGASDALNRLADEKECTVIYLVDRSEQMNGRLKYWLSDHGFPAGPVLAMKPVASGRGQTTGLADLRRAYPGVIMGIGGDIASSQAFLDNGMAAFMLPGYEANPDEMRGLADDIEELPDSAQLSVVNSWQEIEGVVFHDIRRSAEEYAERLEKLADEIEKMQKHDQQEG